MVDRSPFTLEQLAGLPLVHAAGGPPPVPHTFVYRSLPDVQLQADLYRPEQLTPGQRCLTVIMIHGGPVTRQTQARGWRMFRDYAALLSNLGMVMIVFDHRLHGPAEYFTAKGDVTALLEHVRTHAASYNVDPERLVLWAFAGSGPLLTVALNPRRDHVRGLIAYYCLLDFAAPSRSGAQAPREILEGLSPATQLRRYGCAAPILVARAGRDTPAVNRSLTTFMEAALDNDVPVELLNHPEGALCFDVRNDDRRSREIIARTLAFIRARAE